MFQNLTQGSVISIFYRQASRIVDAKVLSSNTHLPQFNPQQPMAMMNGPVTDITVQVDGETIPFAGLPANAIMANFPDKGMFISTDRNVVLRELDSSISSIEQDLSSVPAKEKLLADYKALRLDLNPDLKKEEEYSREMAAMRSEMSELKELVRASLGRLKTTE